MSTLTRVDDDDSYSDCEAIKEQNHTMEGLLDDDNDNDDDGNDVHSVPRSSWVFATSTMQRLSLGVGLLLGIFMQCSMLGIYAFFISSSTTTSGIAAPMMDDRLFSALWTVLVSGLGVLALRILQSMVAAAARSMIHENDPRATSGTYLHGDILRGTVAELVTRPATCGGLLGVCGASLAMSYAVWGQARLCRPDLDVSHSLVGNRMFSLLSSALYMGSGVVLVWILYAPRSDVVVGPPIRSVIDSTQSGDSSPLTQPLLAVSDEQYHHHCKESMSIMEPELSKESARVSTSVTRIRSSSRWHLQWSSLLLGSLIGWLIQCASLSANVWIVHFHQSLQQLHSPQPSDSAVLVGPDAFLRQRVLHTSLAWSLVSSGMGIGLLFLVRSLLMQLPIVLQDAMSTVSKSTKGGSFVSLADHKHILLRVECYMAVGAVFGLNLAWTITEYALGMEKSHWYQSLWIVLGTMVWCKFVLYCCGSQHHVQPHDGGQVSRGRSCSVDGSMVV
jgi:hypothetical protein